MAKRRKLKNVVTEAPKKSNAVYDLRSKDLPHNARVAPRHVDDPYEQGAQIIAFESIRDDPLARMYHHRYIDSVQRQAGDKWREAYEIAEIGGCKSIDPGKEAVDGGQIVEPFTDRQLKACRKLDAGRKALGPDRDFLIREVLGKRRFIKHIANAYGYSERQTARLGEMFRESLEILAVVYGCTNFAKAS